MIPALNCARADDHPAHEWAGKPLSARTPKYWCDPSDPLADRRLSQRAAMASPPCLSDEPVPTAVREADAMLGMWAEMFRINRTRWGVAEAIRSIDTFGGPSSDEPRAMLLAALIRLTDPA